MMTARRLVQMVEAADFGRVVHGVTASGRAIPPGVRRQLDGRDDLLQLAALSLATQRVCDLTWGPSPEAAWLVQRLSMESASADPLDVGAMAFVAAALCRFEEVVDSVCCSGSSTPGSERVVMRLASLLEAGASAPEVALVGWLASQTPAFDRALSAARASVGVRVSDGLGRELASAASGSARSAA